MASKAKKSKFFRIGVEGDTTDGREIQTEWLEQMANNFNPEKYGCRLNCEHIRGLMPDGPFGAYGDVLALKTETIEIEGEKKLALMAQISPNDDLLALNKKRKKVYTSMEIDFNFAKTGECYLQGLAITDSPASLSTEMLKFAANASDNPFQYRKQKPENVFSAALEIELEFEDSTSLLDRVKSMFTASAAQQSEKDTDSNAAIIAIAGEVANLQEQFSQQGNGSGNSEKIQQLSASLKSTQSELASLTQQLEGVPNFNRRPPASGGAGEQQVTDC